MKRLPVDSSRPFRSSRYSIPQGPGGRGEPTLNDAATYLMEVKDMFQDNPEKYDLFRELISDFQAKKIDTTGVRARVKELCKGYNNQISGFNIFMPEGYEITVAEEDKLPPTKTGDFENAISFVMKIKERFQNDDHVYTTFLDILNMYKKGDKGLDEVYHEVASLFDGHPDLLSDYRDFF